VTYLIAEHHLSVTRSCRCIGLSRAAYYQIPKGHDRDAEVIEAINTVIDKHPRWGFWKCFKVLRRSHRWNHKRVYRVYCGLHLNQKRRAKKRLSQRVKRPLIVPPQPNQNAYMERFNKTYRNEVLDLYLFRNLNEVREATHWWKSEYNEERPHDSLGDLTPAEYMLTNAGSSTLQLST